MDCKTNGCSGDRAGYFSTLSDTEKTAKKAEPYLSHYQEQPTRVMNRQIFPTETSDLSRGLKYNSSDANFIDVLDSKQFISRLILF